MSADSASKAAAGTVEVSDNKTGTVTTVTNDFNGDLFLKFRIKEDWIFDTKRSIFEPRIVGIAPLKFNEVSKQWQPVFWVYYTEAREILTKKRLINTNNDASSLSFDDFFIRRLFSSYIVKESNPGDNKIRDIITDPRERLMESERIKKSVLDYEQGLWEY
jgi:gliding motility associated protien GldN